MITLSSTPGCSPRPFRRTSELGDGPSECSLDSLSLIARAWKAVSADLMGFSQAWHHLRRHAFVRKQKDSSSVCKFSLGVSSSNPRLKLRSIRSCQLKIFDGPWHAQVYQESHEIGSYLSNGTLARRLAISLRLISIAELSAALDTVLMVPLAIVIAVVIVRLASSSCPSVGIVAHLASPSTFYSIQVLRTSRSPNLALSTRSPHRCTRSRFHSAAAPTGLCPRAAMVLARRLPARPFVDQPPRLGGAVAGMIADADRDLGRAMAGRL